MAASEESPAARDFLVSVPEDYDRGVAEFRWPELPSSTGRWTTSPGSTRPS